jgi:Mor family transcriptional regulator
LRRAGLKLGVTWGESMTAGQRSGDRDLRILEAFAEGTSVEELAIRYGLSRERVGTIIRAERLKVEVSPLPEYRRLRTALKRYGE